MALTYIDRPYGHYKKVPNLPRELGQKRKKPTQIAVVDEDNCTGCQVCIPFCPVDCIEPVPPEKHATPQRAPIPPVQIRFDECIGCCMCAQACTHLTWDAIRMIPTEDFEKRYGITISGEYGQA
jgi:Pyruvate/2-oxoacid:ferredoxin oxidoreductase delta subunit